MRKSRKLQMYIMDWLYPNRCPCCGKGISWERYICTACESQMEMETDTFCPFCGKAHLSCTCETGDAYDHAVVVTAYDGAARSGVLSMKTGTSLHFGWYCGTVLAEQILHDEALAGYDCIIPVPMAKKKKRQQRINPAQVISKEIARQTGIPLRTDILWNDGKGGVQHRLSAKKRRENVQQFHANPVSLAGYRVILCDDVLTTGNTLHACAELIRACGAEAIAIAVATSTIMRTQDRF